MVNAEKAVYVQKEDAIQKLKKYPKNPLIAAKVQISTWRYVDHIFKIVHTTVCTSTK